MLCAIMRIPVTLLLAAAAFLVLVNLGHVAFWDDEAHVALFGRALLASHHNLAWDGRNLVPSQNGSWLDKDLLQIFPQLDNYVAAASFAVFGDSPWAGRLPFALCGIASLVVFWRLLLLEFPGFPTLQLYALACASLSAPLLLYFRNCRYYGLSVLLTGGPEDVGRTMALIASCGGPSDRLASIAGRFGIAELIDVVGHARCVVSVNTGVMHLAAAVGTWTIALNGPTSSSRWGPIGPRTINIDSSLPGCGFLNLGFEYDGQRTDCMQGITVDRVEEALTTCIDD